MATLTFLTDKITEAFQKIATSTCYYQSYQIYMHLYAKATPNLETGTSVIDCYVTQNCNTGNFRNNRQPTHSISFGQSAISVGIYEGDISRSETIKSNFSFSVQHDQSGHFTGLFSWTGRNFDDPFSDSATLSVPDTLVPPTINAMQLNRCDGVGNIQNDGHFAKLIVDASANQGTIQNVKVSWEGGTANITQNNVFGGTFAEDKQYTLSVEVSGSNGLKTTSTIVLSASSIPLSLGDDGQGHSGVAFGGYARIGYLDSYLPLGVGFDKFVTIYETETQGIAEYTVSNIDDYDFIILCCALGGNDIQCQIVPATMFKNGRVVSYVSAVSTSQVRYLFARVNPSGLIDASNKGDATGGIRYIYGVTKK